MDGHDIGRKIGHIRVLERIARGGMGDVFVGLDETLQRRVAIKAVRAEFRLQPDAKRRFLAEARTLSQIEHPNICRVHDFIEGDDCDYLVLELVEGRSLFEIVAEGPSRNDAIEIARQILDVLVAVHARGIVHRDLKPDNVMVAADGRVKVLDFGLARSGDDGIRDTGPAQADPVADNTPNDFVVPTRVGTVIGTPGYMSPEQARGESATTASDVYAAGLLLHELLTGRPAFPTGLPNVALVEMAAKGESLRACGLPPDLELLVERLKSPSPEARPTAAEAAEMLDRILELPRRRRRRLVAVGITAVIAIASAVPAGLWLRERARSATQASLAQRFAAEARDVEWLMRVAHMLPTHDIRPTRAEIRNRIASLKLEIDRLGPVAAGPGRYAIGRGLLALGEWREARTHLRRAWDNGYRTPEVACALGVAIGGLYRQELELAGRIADPEQRHARKIEASRTLGHQALEFQRLGSGAHMLPAEYLAALLAFDEDRFDDAIAFAESARTEVPWLYEASLIAARATLELGERDYRHGRSDEALDRYAQVLEIVSNVVAVAPSDAGARSLEASAWNAIALVRLYSRTGDPIEAAESALAACDVTDTIDSDSLSAVTARSTAHLAAAIGRERRGEDAGEELRLAEAAAERAVRLGPESAVAQFNLGFVREHAGELESAAQAYRSALDLDPTSARIHNNLGNVYRLSARWDEAIAEFEEAIRLDPHLRIAHTNLQVVLLFDTGRIADGVLACRRQLAIDDSSPWGHTKLAEALMFLGDLEGARAEAQRAIELDSSNTEALWTLATILRLAGEPNDALAQVERYNTVAQGDSWGHYLACILYRRLGDTVSGHRELELFLEAARRDVERTPGDFGAHVRLALGLARRGETEAALAEARRVPEPCTTLTGCGVDIARVLAVCGHTDEALAKLREALDSGYRNVIWIFGSQDLETLLGDPRFKRLLAPYRHSVATGAGEAAPRSSRSREK